MENQIGKSSSRDESHLEGLTKKCYGCGVLKHHDEFYKKGNRLESRCKICKGEAVHRNYKRKKEKMRVYPQSTIQGVIEVPIENENFSENHRVIKELFNDFAIDVFMKHFSTDGEQT